MLYFNTSNYGVKVNPTKDTPYFIDWKGDTYLPPPETDLMITEGGDYMITQATNDYMIME